MNRNPNSVYRPCFSYEYVGDDYAELPHKEFIIDSLDGIDMGEMKKMLTELKRKNYITIIHSRIHEETALVSLCREMGIRTELLYICNRISKKHRGKDELIELKPGEEPVYGKVE